MSEQPPSLPHAGSFSDYFSRYANAHQLQFDLAQQALARQLDEMAGQLSGHGVVRLSGALSRLISAARPALSPQQGMYIWGDVGRGKSMLMNQFFEWLPSTAKKRMHFHAFMREVHARMHAWRQLKTGDDMLPRVVKEMGQGIKLLCLDEIQVHDVTDAMILSRLFTLLLDMGVMVMFTSNRAPESLYQSGLQREQFEAFIALIRAKLQVVELKSPHDYRLQQLRDMKQVYKVCGPEGGDEWLYDAYQSLTAGAESEAVTLEVQGRSLLVEKAASGVAWMTFSDLCERPLGAGDYLELASIFHTLLLQDIPQLSPEMRNEAKRFVTLIDALYEQKVKLICTAAAPPEALYPSGDGSFEFQRTASRLQEMQSEGYLASSHQKAPL